MYLCNDSHHVPIRESVSSALSTPIDNSEPENPFKNTKIPLAAFSIEP